MGKNESQDVKVSVVIPTYKRDVAFVSRAVNSVLNQTYENIEVVVVDDSPSTYEKRSEVAEYMNGVAKADERIVYIMNSKNLGGSLARNVGIDASKGEFITFLDDDDEYKPEKVARQVAFMLERGCDVSFSNMVMYNNAGKVVDVREYHDIPAFDNESLLKYHLMHHMTGTPTFMYRAEKLREIGGFEDAKMGQEFYLMLKTIERGLSIGYIDNCDVIVYKHGGEAISNGKNKITGEKNVFEFKKKYFSRMSAKEIRFIKFRHEAVMTVAYIRNKNYISALGSAIRAFFTAPVVFFKQVFGFIGKIVGR